MSEKEGSEEKAVTMEDLNKERKKVEDLTVRLKYMQADLENLRKRADREVREAGEAPVKSLVGKLLVVLDELELASKHAEEDESGQLKEGIAMVRRNLSAALESVGVERIECVGRPFDPSLHEAVEKVEGGGDDDLVVEELRPGYMFRGQLLRPSMVKVQLAKSAPAEAEADE